MFQVLKRIKVSGYNEMIDKIVNFSKHFNLRLITIQPLERDRLNFVYCKCSIVISSQDEYFWVNLKNVNTLEEFNEMHDYLFNKVCKK
jgi:hypothetical protein